MKNHTAPLQLNVGFIAQQSVGFSRDFLFEIPHLALQTDLVLHDLVGKIDISRTSEGLLAQGTFHTSTDATCGRCLEECAQQLKIDFTELFTFESHAQVDTDLILSEDGYIDFEPLVREYILLEMPINPVCKEDCKGLCPLCGNNLNDVSCDHTHDDVDPRLAILKTFLDED